MKKMAIYSVSILYLGRQDNRFRVNLQSAVEIKERPFDEAGTKAFDGETQSKTGS